MRLFVVSVASVAFSRQKAGNASDALSKDGSNLEQLATLKKRKLLALIISRQAKFGKTWQVLDKKRNKKRHFSAKGKT
jgi:hypothetical protein